MTARRAAIAIFRACAGAIFCAACAPTLIPAPVAEVGRGGQAEFAEPAVERPEAHQVRQGETLQEIGLRYGLDYKDLAVWNQIDNPDHIEVGANLALAPTPNSPKIDAVRPLQSVVVTPAPTPRTRIVGGDQSAPQAAAANAPRKEGPLAVAQPYSRQAWRQIQSAEKKRIVAPAARQPASDAAPAAAAAPLAVAPPPAESTSSPLAVRRRFDVDWSWPVGGRVIGSFNERRKGIDIAGDLGDPIRASGDGKVVYVGDGLKSYGNMVIVKHGNEYVSAYAHASKILTREGATVARGDIIAEMGDSGAERVQLHLEIRKAGKPVDPAQFLPRR